jgi:hypothetical protein
MTSAPVSRTAVERTLPTVQDQLGQADRRRLAALLPLIGEDRRTRLSEALAALFPDQDRTAALASFQRFREQIAVSASGPTIVSAVLKSPGCRRTG